MPVSEYSELLIQYVRSEQRVSVVAHAHLDSPKPRQACTGGLTVSGWLLPREKSQPVEAVIINGEDRQTYPLNVDRPDVLKVILGINDAKREGDERLRCGFSIDLLHIGSSIHIAFSVAGVEYPWLSISRRPSGATVQAVERLWSKVCHGEHVDADLRVLGSQLERLDDDLLGALLFDRVEEVRAVDILAGKKVSGLERCSNLVQYASREEFCRNAVHSAVTKGTIIVPDPFGYGMAFSNESYVYSDEINVLKFVSATNEIFFIFQLVSSADAIYFPTRHRVVTFLHIDAARVEHFVCRLFRDLQQVVRYTKAPRRFLGLIASQSRPYHFYYEVATAMSDLNAAGLLNDIPSIIYYKGGDFCSFKQMWKLPATERRLTPKEVQARSIKESGFHFHVGTLFDSSRLNSVDYFDRQFIGHARQQAIQQKTTRPAELLGYYPLVWFGITVHKRSWVEQVQGAGNLLNELFKTYPTMAVVFDGWTSPLNPLPRDLAETAKDQGVARQITTLLNPGIKTFSVIGAGSVPKVLVGKCADVYVGNAATGGLHVARFAGCPGVAHLNTKMISADNHIRKRTRLVDPSCIIDQPDDAGRRMDYISYSLDWRAIYREVVNILRGLSV